MLIRWLGWRSIFGLVVPLGIAAFVLALPAFEESRDPGRRRFDAGAQVAGAVALGAATLAAIEAEHARLAAGALALALVALRLFVSVEHRLGEAALVPLALFRAPAFRGAIAATAAMTFGMYGVLFLLPLTWQGTGAMGPLGAGLALMPMALMFVAVSPWSGHLAERIGARAATAGGVAVIGLGLLALAAGGTGLAIDEAGLVLTGLGMGVATGPLFGVAAGAVSAGRSGTAGSLINVARMTGATVGVALLGALYSARGGGAGLQLAMLCGGAVQLAGAGYAWITVGREAQASSRTPKR